MNCTNLSEFIYEGSELQSIQTNVFFNCTSLKKFELLYLQNSNQKLGFNESLNNEKYSFFIGFQAFMNCTSLVEVIIENYSFNNSENSSSPTESKINSICSRIKKYAFCNCKSLEKARFLLENLEYIEQKAFYDCSSLNSIELNSFKWDANNANNYFFSIITSTKNKKNWRCLIYRKLNNYIKWIIRL